MSAINCLKACSVFLLTLLSFAGFAQLRADFSATPTSGCAPLIVRFSDQSTGNPTEWKWDLGNGTISFLRNPSVTYFEPGQYTVKLVVKTWNNADSIVKTQYINVYAKPTVDFVASSVTGCYPLPVQFTDLTVANNGTLTHWQWDFGDGTTSTDQHPTHTYNSSGNFNVSLQVRNSSGCVAAISKTAYVQINTGVLASFTNANTSTCSAPASISFNNTSTGTGSLTYKWLFGDGETSIESNPTHTYQTVGVYTVSLIVYNGNGCTDTIVKPNAIALGTVLAGFTSNDSVCAGTNINFTNRSTPTPASVFWNFGNGQTSTALNPVYAYPTGGTYQVKMVANFGACNDSVTKSITVFSKPNVRFVADDSTNCTTPFTVNFTNQTVGGTSYLWKFGDNTTSTDENPSHVFTAFRAYTVTLLVTNANGCVDSLVKTNYIRIRKPVISFNTILPDSSCAPFTKTFRGFVTGFEQPVTWAWNFGDGNTSNLAQPTNTYTVAGVYPVTLVITTASGCRDSVTMTRAIIAGDRPTLMYDVLPRVACASNAVNFRDSTAGATSWLWQFGDGSFSTQQNPSHLYQDTGRFTVKLTVWSNGCADSVRLVDYVYINPPIAKYKVRVNCVQRLDRSFIDQSIGANKWYWDFGDGQTDTIRNPNHSYAAAGTYNTSLRVVNTTTGCEYTKFIQVKLVDVKAAFVASDTTPCKGTAVSFTTGLSASDVNRFTWTFGDTSAPIITTRPYEDHTYFTNGTYSVQLIIRDVLGCFDTLVKNNYIRVDGPTARFSTALAGSCLNSLVVFNDSSSSDGIHPLQSWMWNYGDGITDSLTAGPFQHAYANSGQYLVGLKVRDTKGCIDSVRMTAPFVVSQPTAAFSTTDTLTCPGQAIHFTNASLGTNLTYVWDFGDGQTAVTANPVHVYAADGVYNVKLTVFDLYGCSDSLIQTALVTIISPRANFIMSDSIAFCPPLLVQFTDMSTNALSKVWDFGDATSSPLDNPSHFYTIAGVYRVRLTVTGPGGCTNYMERTITVKGPNGSFTYTPQAGCNPLRANFVGHTREDAFFIWDFNDGNLENSADSTIAHTYIHPGTYVPKMILMDAFGCKVPIVGTDTIVVKGVTAKFGFNPQALCDSGLVTFTDSSFANDVISQYQWNFGNGQFSNASNPSVVYAAPGNYYPSLIVRTASGCEDTLVVTNPIKVVASPRISMLATGNGCTPLRVQFAGQLTRPDTSAIRWAWNFGNGNTASVTHPPLQTYNVAGVYNATLTATNSSGCATTLTRVVESYAVPTVSAGADRLLCSGSTMNLVATGALNYSWSPAIGLDCTNCPNPVTSTLANRQYVVTGTTIHGCSSSDTINITVKNKFNMTVGPGQTVCRGSGKQIKANGANMYTWSPSTGLRNTYDSVQVASPDATTTYRVIGEDNVGCFKDTGFVTVTVHPIPTVEAGNDKTINVGQSVELLPTISNDVTEVVWFPTDGLTRNAYPGVTLKPTTNVEYTVEVKNAGGCAARDKVTVYVICNGGNVYIPNTFSPDGNGVNDEFYPRGTGLYRIKNMKIYNRWGEMIFERNSFLANDANAGWDGTFKGVKLNADVYVYTIDIICDNNAVLQYRGNVALIR